MIGTQIGPGSDLRRDSGGEAPTAANLTPRPIGSTLEGRSKVSLAYANEATRLGPKFRGMRP